MGVLGTVLLYSCFKLGLAEGSGAIYQPTHTKAVLFFLNEHSPATALHQLHRCRHFEELAGGLEEARLVLHTLLEAGGPCGVT